MRYSKTTGCFYPKAINYKTLPDDIIDVPQADFEAAMARGIGDTLDVVDGALVVVAKPAPTLDALKRAKTNEITAAFDAEIKAGFVTASGIKMNADIGDIQRLKSAYDLAKLLDQENMPVVVDYGNNTHANLPLPDVLAMIIELGVHYQALYAKKQTLRGQVSTAANQNELDSITWS